MFRNKLLAMIVLTVAAPAIAVTNFTGNVNTDIANAGNWDNGLPTNTGANDGVVPNGFTGLTGSPIGKNIVFNGNSGYNSSSFGGNQANGYDITFNGTGNSSFTSNGLFLAWDGGAANKSDFAWNSTGTLNTTRFFIGRFGEGDFVQTAGAVNQNSSGTFDFLIGELGGSEGSSYTLTNGTLNAAGELAIRRGAFNQSGGIANFNHSNGIVFGEGGTVDGFYNLSGGVVNLTTMSGFNGNDAFNFTAGSTGVLNALNLSIVNIENLITAGRITLDGAQAQISDFNITTVQNTQGQSFTQVSLPQVDSAIPEPASLVLLGLAAGGMMSRRRRRLA